MLLNRSTVNLVGNLGLLDEFVSVLQYKLLLMWHWDSFSLFGFKIFGRQAAPSEGP